MMHGPPVFRCPNPYCEDGVVKRPLGAPNDLIEDEENCPYCIGGEVQYYEVAVLACIEDGFSRDELRPEEESPR